MDVHPIKNGINRYWSIPIFSIFPRYLPHLPLPQWLSPWISQPLFPFEPCDGRYVQAPDVTTERPLQKWVKTACLLSHLDEILQNPGRWNTWAKRQLYNDCILKKTCVCVYIYIIYIFICNMYMYIHMNIYTELYRYNIEVVLFT
jgi:hypothetical protein